MKLVSSMHNDINYSCSLQFWQESILVPVFLSQCLSVKFFISAKWLYVNHSSSFFKVFFFRNAFIWINTCSPCSCFVRQLVWWLPAMFCNAGSISLTLFSHEKWSTVTYVADAWKQWARERMGAREEDTWGERERLPGRPTKIVSRPQSNYLEAAMWSVKNFDRKQLTSHKQSVPLKALYILSLV